MTQKAAALKGCARLGHPLLRNLPGLRPAKSSPCNGRLMAVLAAARPSAAVLADRCGPGFEGRLGRGASTALANGREFFLGDLARASRRRPIWSRSRTGSEETLAVVQDLVQRQLALVLTLLPPPKGGRRRAAHELRPLHRHLRRFSVVYGEGAASLYSGSTTRALLPEVVEFMQPAQRRRLMKPPFSRWRRRSGRLLCVDGRRTPTRWSARPDQEARPAFS